MNPDLITAGESHQMPGVPGFTNFRGQTAELPTVHTKVDHYYIMVMPAASMHRADGKRLAFVHGILKTDIKADIDYMKEQIENGSQYVREATVNEVREYNIKMDPKGTMRKEVEEELRGTLEEEIRAQLMAELMASGQLNITPIGQTQQAVDAANGDATRLAGTQTPPAKDVIKTANATLTMQPQNPAPSNPPQTLAEKLAAAKRISQAAESNAAGEFQKLESKPSGVGGQNTNDIKGAAAGSSAA